MSGQPPGITTSSSAVPTASASTVGGSQPAGTPRKTLQDTIREIEAQITFLEQTPNATSRQQEDLAKLKELHTRALAEQEKLKSNKQQVQQQQQPAETTPARTSTPPIAPSTANSTTSQSASSVPSTSHTVAPPVVSKHNAMATGIHSGIDPNQVLDKKRIQDLVKEVDPNTQLDEDVEEMLLQIADDFIENIVTAGCQLAKHRKSNTLEAKDILLHLERNWNMLIPGYSMEENRQYKRPASTEAHKQRMALIRKALKK